MDKETPASYWAHDSDNLSRGQLNYNNSDEESNKLWFNNTVVVTILNLVYSKDSFLFLECIVIANIS